MHPIRTRDCILPFPQHLINIVFCHELYVILFVSILPTPFHYVLSGLCPPSQTVHIYIEKYSSFFFICFKALSCIIFAFRTNVICYYSIHVVTKTPEFIKGSFITNFGHHSLTLDVYDLLSYTFEAICGSFIIYQIFIAISSSFIILFFCLPLPYSCCCFFDIPCLIYLFSSSGWLYKVYLCCPFSSISSQFFYDFIVYPIFSSIYENFLSFDLLTSMPLTSQSYTGK